MQYLNYIIFLNSILTKDHKKKLFFLIFLMIILVLFESLSFGLIIPIIENLLLAQNQHPFFDQIYNNYNFFNFDNQFVFYSFIFFTAYITKIFFFIFFSWYQNNFFCIILGFLSDKLYRKYINQSILFHKNSNISLLLRNLITELSVFIRDGISSIILIISDLLIIFSLILIILFYEPEITSILVIFLTACSLFFVKINIYFLKKWSHVRQDSEGLRLKFLNQGLFSIKEVKIYNKENWITSKFFKFSNAAFQALRNYSFLQALPRMFLELLLIISIVLCVLFFTKSDQLDSGLSYLGIIVFASFRILPILSKLLRSVQSLTYSKPSYELLKNEFALSYSKNDEFTKDKFIFKDKIFIKDLSFKYSGSKKNQLNKISLEINKNDCIGLVGESGQGKSTFLDIFMGLLNPNTGEILIDGKNINTNFRAWQNLIGYVPQSFYMSDDSIKNNIAFGEESENINLEKLYKVVNDSKLNLVIKNLPKGIDENIGNQGGKLSGGERQRIAIARALYFEPEILILDESTSSLDIETEKNIMDSIKELFKSKTSIIIAHRKSALVNCNKIFEMKNGNLTKIK